MEPPSAIFALFAEVGEDVGEVVIAHQDGSSVRAKLTSLLHGSNGLEPKVRNGIDPLRLQQVARHLTRDANGLRQGAALNDQALDPVGSCQEDTFRQSNDLDHDLILHSLRKSDHRWITTRVHASVRSPINRAT